MFFIRQIQLHTQVSNLIDIQDRYRIKVFLSKHPPRKISTFATDLVTIFLYLLPICIMIFLRKSKGKNSQATQFMFLYIIFNVNISQIHSLFIGTHDKKFFLRRSNYFYQ